MFAIGRLPGRLCPHLEHCCSVQLPQVSWKCLAARRIASCRQTHARQSKRKAWCCSAAAAEEATVREVTTVDKKEEKSFAFKFLIFPETASFIEREDGKHLAALQRGLDVSAELSKSNDKAVRSLLLRGASPASAAAFLDKLLLSAEEAGQAALPTTKDGSRLKMRALLPSSLAGFLLGTGGKRLQGIATTTDCLINIAERKAEKQSNFRLISFAGSRRALVQGVKIVLTALCEDDRFFRIPDEKAFITVPKKRVTELNALLVDIRAKARSKVSTAWVKLPASLKGQQVKQLLLSGRPAAVQQAKQQVEDILASPPASVATEISTVVASVEQAVSSEEEGAQLEGEGAALAAEAGTPTQDTTEVGPISGMDGLNPSAEGVSAQDIPKETVQETAAMPS